MLDLKRIELNGFKSFALGVSVDVRENLLGIVGPNGSGKSNLLDAIHFVFGEQKPSLLRVARLSDLIFGGSQTHSPLGAAQVSLSFEYREDEEEEPAPADMLELVPLTEFDQAIEYASAPPESELREPDEDAGAEEMKEESLDDAEVAELSRLRRGDAITLSRSVYRDGASGYYINGRQVTLSTVDKFFTRFQLGRLATFSINQGEVEKKLLASPEEIREWLGEASGVALLLKAQGAILRKLERSERNLTRAKDILSTLTGEVESLRLQTEDTERADYLRKLRWHLLAIRARGRLLSAASRRERILGEREGHRSRASRLAEGREECRQREQKAESRLAEIAARESELQDELNRFQDELARERISESVLAEKQRASERRGEEATGQVSGLKARREKLDAEMREVASQLARAKDGLGELGVNISTAEGEQTKQANAESWAADEQAELAAELARVEKEQAVAGEKSRTLSAELESLTARRDDAEATDRKQTQQALRLEEETARLARELDEKSRRLGREEEELDGLRRQVAECGGELLACEKERAALREKLGSLRTAKENYEELRRDFYELEELKAGELTVTPLLDLIGFSREWSQAVVASLGEVAAGYVVEGEIPEAELAGDEVKGVFITPEKGPTETAAESAAKPRPYASLWDEIEARPQLIQALRRGLGEFAIVDSTNEGWRLLEQHPEVAAVVLRGRPLILRRGLIKKGTPGRGSALFKKHAELPAVEQAIKENEALLGDRRRQIDALEQRGGDLTAEVQKREKQVRNLQAMVSELKAQAAAGGSRLEALSGERSALDAEKRTLAAKLAEMDKRIAQVEEAVERNAKHIASRKAELAQVAGNLEAARSLRTEAEKLFQKLKVEQVRVAGERERHEAESARLEKEMQQVDARLTELAASRKETAREREELAKLAEATASHLEVLSAEVKRLRSEQAILSEERSELTFEREAAREELRKLEESQMRLESSAGAYDERYWQADQDLGEALREVHSILGVGMGTLMRRLAGELLFPRVQPADFFPVFGVESDETIAPSAQREQESRPLLNYHALKERELEEELARIERALANLGEVNPLAPREYGEKSERCRFLKNQEQDLKLAIADMENALARLERRTRERFARGLKRIETKFNELFVRLFGSGFARFKLTDPENLLSSGIEVEVQLPNARRQNIKALSGGERSLLFIALFLAVHMVRPGSFCVLDEVDAALDDVNVERFCNLLKELAVREQFVIITHNRHTMKVMHRLVGVVTQPKGISRILEVSLREAESYAESGAA